MFPKMSLSSQTIAKHIREPGKILSKEVWRTEELILNVKSRVMGGSILQIMAPFAIFTDAGEHGATGETAPKESREAVRTHVHAVVIVLVVNVSGTVTDGALAMVVKGEELRKITEDSAMAARISPLLEYHCIEYQ